MEHVVLCPNPYRDLEFRVTLQAKKLLEEAGYEVLISPLFSTLSVET